MTTEILSVFSFMQRTNHWLECAALTQPAQKEGLERQLLYTRVLSNNFLCLCFICNILLREVSWISMAMACPFIYLYLGEQAHFRDCYGCHWQFLLPQFKNTADNFIEVSQSDSEFGQTSPRSCSSVWVVWSIIVGNEWETENGIWVKPAAEKRLLWCPAM